MANEESTLQFMMQALDQYSSMAKNMTETARNTLGSFLDAFHDNTGARALKKYLNANEKNSVAVYFSKKEHQNKLEKTLKENGVCFVSCKRADMNGNAMFLVADKDVSAVDILFNKTRAEINKGGVVSKDVLWDQADGDVLKLTDVNAEELLLFDQKAKKSGVNIAIQNKYDVLFDKKDAVKMQHIAASVTYDTCGKAGKLLMQQAEYENKNACRIGDRVLQQEKHPFYIVDRDGGIGMCTDKSFEYIKQDKRVLFKKAPMVSQKGQDIFTKDAEKEYRRLNQFVMTLNHPIDLTESEYRKYKSLDEFRKAAFLKEIDKKHGAIDLTQGEQRLLQAHEQSRDIMEEKIYRQTSNEYEEEQKEPRAGLFAAEERLLDAERLKETKIEQIDEDLLEDAVKKNNKYIFVKELMNPKKEKYFHEAMDGKIHSRTYEEIRTVVEDWGEKEQEYDISWDEDSRENDNLEYFDACDKDDNGIPDHEEDR